MVTRSGKSPHVEHPPTAQTMLRAWRADRSISKSSAQQYLQWIARLRRYFGELGLVEAQELTLEGVRRLRSWYVQGRKIDAAHLGLASSSMHALRRVYEVMDIPVPPWRQVERRPPPASRVLRDYAEHLAQHRGNPEVTVLKKVDHIGKLFDHLAASGKTWRQMRLPDIDEFLIQCAYGYSRATTADVASSVRSFSRFLLASGHINVDLADGVISPVQPPFERPRRAWPWE